MISPLWRSGRIFSLRTNMQGKIWAILGNFVSIAGILGAEVTDGLWNGKPWEREALSEGVEKSDPAALAEWAYCTREGWGGLKYDEGKIFRFAERAAEGGSLLGDAILGRCYLQSDGVEKDENRALELARKSAEGGHPLGFNGIGHIHFSGQAGLPRNLEKGIEMWDKAIEGGCVISRENRFLFGYHKLGSDEVIKETVTVLRDFQGMGAARMVLTLLNKGTRSSLLDAEIQKLALDRIKSAVAAGHLDSMTALGVHYTYQDRDIDGLPLILRGAAQPDSHRSGVAFHYALGLSDSRRGSSVGQDATIYRLAREAFGAGNETRFVAQWTANSYLIPWEEKPVQPELASPAIEILKITPDRDSREAIGRFYGTPENNSHYDPKRAAANLIYSIRVRPQMLEFLARVQVEGEPENLDLVRGYAALQQALKAQRNTSKWLSKSKPLVEKKMSPEQLEEAAQLIEEGYPTGPKFQDEAIAALKEYGDLPQEVAPKNPGR
ncbi:sel1 repeat family protein [Akkermansiaceae bacterium]|nr:sel1 repeat family protein [Akkermansiaceae bacterium]